MSRALAQHMLRYARELIELGECNHICIAMAETWKPFTTKQHEAYSTLKQRINYLLDGRTSVGDITKAWHNQFGQPQSRRQLYNRQVRLNWIDDLLKELETTNPEDLQSRIRPL